MASDTAQPVFLLSLPRSGSTLLQRILAAHAEIATATEPWLLLPYFYALRRDGVVAEYDHRKLAGAVDDFLKELPEGRATYLRAVGAMATSLYGEASPPGTRYFIDKTPRYSLIADALPQAFANAPFIVLWRNPLSVISSIIESFGDGRWCLEQYEIGLSRGLINLVELAQVHAERCHQVRYEDLVNDPLDTCKSLFAFLDLDFSEDLLERYTAVPLRGRFGDKPGQRGYRRVSSDSVQAWKQTLANPIRKRWCRRYLQTLGETRLAAMGYDLQTLLGDLDALAPSRAHLVDDAWRMPSAAVRKASKRLLLDSGKREELNQRFGRPFNRRGTDLADRA